MKPTNEMVTKYLESSDIEQLPQVQFDDETQCQRLILKNQKKDIELSNCKQQSHLQAVELQKEQELFEESWCNELLASIESKQDLYDTDV